MGKTFLKGKKTCFYVNCIISQFGNLAAHSIIQLLLLIPEYDDIFMYES